MTILALIAMSVPLSFNHYIEPDKLRVVEAEPDYCGNNSDPLYSLHSLHPEKLRFGKMRCCSRNRGLPSITEHT